MLFLELYTGDFPIKIGVIFHWMIFGETFKNLLRRLSNEDFFLNQAVLLNCFFNVSFCRDFPNKKDIFFCLDAAQRLL